MKTRNAWLLSMVAGVGVCALVVGGCESTDTDSHDITVYPSVARINSGRGAGQTFGVATVQGQTVESTTNGTTTAQTTGSTNETFYYPLVWSVSDPSLGVIRSSEGNTAFYEVIGGEGNNVITVRDQGSSRGQAVVAQRSYY